MHYTKFNKFYPFLAFREVFDMFDTHGGGGIAPEDLEVALLNADIKITKGEVAEVFMNMDEDGKCVYLFLSANTHSVFEQNILCKFPKSAEGVGEIDFN